MKKHWSILKMNEKLAKTFERDAIISIISFKRSRKLREIIDGNTIIDRNIKKKEENMNGKCRPCNRRKNTMCCRQVKTIISFTSYKNVKTFNTFHDLTYKKKFLI